VKRKDTSKLLNEWKSFLNEVENNEIEKSPSMDFDSINNRQVEQRSLSLGENEDFETIIGIMFEKGKSAEEIQTELQRLAQKSTEEIAAIAQNINDSFYEDPLENDEDLSFLPEE
tara:strand:- start:387 stop:731 length:345 start_codon:yes stop_codon:yes gene_type:complete